MSLNFDATISFDDTQEFLYDGNRSRYELPPVEWVRGKALPIINCEESVMKILENLRNGLLIGFLVVTTGVIETKPTFAQEAPKTIPLCADLSLFPHGTSFPGPEFHYSSFVFRRVDGASSLLISTIGFVRGLRVPYDGGLEVTLPIHVSTVDFEVGAGNAPLHVSALNPDRKVIAQRTIPKTATPVADRFYLFSDKEIAYLLFEKGRNENVVAKVCVTLQMLGNSTKQCDSSLRCTQVETCVDGLRYPTTCGPENCDESIGICEEVSGGEKQAE